jgi:hypothetical protein
LNGGEKISGQFVVAGRDGAKVLNFVEEALDEIALAVERNLAIPFKAYPLTQVRLYVVGAPIPPGSAFFVDCLA